MISKMKDMDIKRASEDWHGNYSLENLLQEFIIPQLISWKNKVHSNEPYKAVFFPNGCTGLYFRILFRMYTGDYYSEEMEMPNYVYPVLSRITEEHKEISLQGHCLEYFHSMDSKGEKNFHNWVFILH